MDAFRPEKEVCPACGASQSCHFHASYDRNLIDFVSGCPVYHSIRISRVICSGCGHSHSILPDLIIPYSTYGLLFILRVIAEYLTGIHTVEQLCARFGISHSMLYRWFAIYLSHKEEWLGVLASAETSPLAFLKDICRMPAFSVFACSFVMQTAVSFLQSHRNPAPFRQTVF